MLAVLASASLALMAACAGQRPAETIGASVSADLTAVCDAAAVRAVAARVPTHVTIGQIDDGPRLTDGVRYVAAAGALPAYCQVSGNFVTNAATGKTANFLAAFPANWNGKYLQVGCSGHCGQFAVSDVTGSTITITSQGHPGDALKRGYAAFATDEGHSGFGGGAWALNARGEFNQDYLDDFLYRSQMVLSHMGKEFTTAFYAQASGAHRSISRSYFIGCSGGGRDALAVAAYFPEQFDGIVAGSPYASAVGVSAQGVGIALAGIRSADADVSPTLMSRVGPIVMAQCDALDGVQDDLIQNPAACNFRPERDLPRCGTGGASDACFTAAQIQTVSTYLTAVTDEQGNVVQPGFSVSELQASYRVSTPVTPGPNPWPSDNYAPGTGFWALANATLKIFTHHNDPNYNARSFVTLRDGGPGAITDYRAVVQRVDADQVIAAMRMGVGQSADGVIQRDRKMLIWSNLSDQQLTPYMTTNYYRRLAASHGGYERLQRNVRLFDIPGAAHCSMDGVGPNNFDALGAMENWVEHGQAPNALVAGLYPSHAGPFGTSYDYSAAPTRTMPLCAYPAMAHYSGRGDVKDAANWSCPANDRSMLTLGESGKRAGIVPDGS